MKIFKYIKLKYSWVKKFENVIRWIFQRNKKVFLWKIKQRFRGQKKQRLCSGRHTVSIFLKNVQHTASMSGSTAAAYGRAKTLDQQDLGHYITKSIIMPNPLIFKCEWESIEQKKDKKKKRRNLTKKKKNVRKKREKPVRASRLWVQLCVHIVRKI